MTPVSSPDTASTRAMWRLLHVHRDSITARAVISPSGAREEAGEEHTLP